MIPGRAELVIQVDSHPKHMTLTQAAGMANRETNTLFYPAISTKCFDKWKGTIIQNST